MSRTIVMSMYNRSAEVIEVMDHLFFPSLLQNASNDTEVILIDNCSILQKETEMLLSKYGPELGRKFGDVVFRRNPKNLGFAGSFNTGIRMASGKETLVTSNDIYFPRRSVKSLFDTLQEGSGYLMAGPITNAPNTDTHQYCDRAPILSSYESAEIAQLELFAKEAEVKFCDRRMIGELSGFCFAADTQLLQRLGGFDESYGYGYFEDADLVQRVIAAHGPRKIAINLSVFVHHGTISGTSQTMLQQPLRMKYSVFKNRLRYIKRWGWRHFLERRARVRSLKSSRNGTVGELYEKLE